MLTTQLSIVISISLNPEMVVVSAIILFISTVEIAKEKFYTSHFWKSTTYNLIILSQATDYGVTESSAYWF